MEIKCSEQLQLLERGLSILKAVFFFNAHISVTNWVEEVVLVEEKSNKRKPRGFLKW